MWQRRAALVVVATIPVLGLLNVFGQRATSVVYPGTGASLSIDSPTHVRGGLIFTTDIVIRANRTLKDARLLLSNGWFRGMTYNAIAPQPTSQSSSGRWEILGIGPLPAGTRYHLWVSWQVNPTNAGRRSQDVRLYDGSTLLVTANRSFTVFP